jgi:hypothetical protein
MSKHVSEPENNLRNLREIMKIKADGAESLPLVGVFTNKPPKASA